MTALTKGSQRVMANKAMVADLADAVREDAQAHPMSFPPNFYRQMRSKSDQEVAQWFLEQLDNIERQGYSGFVYSRDGANSEWLVRRYIAGSHNWEDIEGTANMNLAKWYFLKNRNLLDPNHSDIPKFESVRAIGLYMVKHYQQALEEYQEKLAAAARKKASKAIKLIDNEDYRVYIILNRAASCSYGLGSNWCTANSESDYNYQQYSAETPLYQVYPTEPEDVKIDKGNKVITGKERYQFDPSKLTSNYANFMDIADIPVSKQKIQTRFPYLGTDVIQALKINKEEIQKTIDDLVNNPELQKSQDLVVKPYKVDQMIQGIEKMTRLGYFSEEVRKPKKEVDDKANEIPEPEDVSIKKIE